jgi:hypothetical protein
LAVKKIAASAFLALTCFTQLTWAQEKAPATSQPLPMTKSPSASNYPKPLTFSQQQARYEAEQRTLRLEWYRWMGYTPSRPSLNASYQSYQPTFYYNGHRGILINANNPRHWYW